MITAARDRPDERPVGLILAGGLSSRFGGGDKVLARLCDRPLLAWVIERLAPQCRALVLSANGDADRFAAFGLPVVPDHAIDRGKGPLAGLLAGFDWVAAHVPEAGAVVTIAGDTPALPRDLVQRLDAARGGAVRVAAARSGGRLHPLAALWELAARDVLRPMLRLEEAYRARDCLERLGARWVDWPATPFNPFHNINHAADLDAAVAWAKRA